MTDKIFNIDLLLLGAAKCGTTTLHQHLSQMPEICMSEPKEPFFFECEFQEGLEFYQQKYFGHWKNENIKGESRHRNLYLPYVAERIHRTNPNARLLILLRNPTERAYSHWWHAYSRDYDDLTFSKAIKQDIKRIEQGNDLSTPAEIETYCSKVDYANFYRTYVDSGYYMNQIERYLKFFDQEQLKVILTEDLEQHPAKVLNEVRIFLSLQEMDEKKIQLFRANSYKKPQAGEKVHQLARQLQLHRILPAEIKRLTYQTYNKYFLKRSKMDSATRNFLIEHYKTHNERLAAFLQRDLSHWNK